MECGDLLGLGSPLAQASPQQLQQQQAKNSGYGSNMSGVLLAGGMGTPCNSPFKPTAQQQTPGTQADSRTSKQVEAERKRAIEAAAAKRCASGKVFPGTSYRLDSTIGKGSYGRVKLATDMRTGQKLAIKFLAKDLMIKQAHWVRVRREINLLTLAHHPHIIKMHEWLESGEDVLLVMEYIQGKDLFDRINEKTEKRYGEREARSIFRQMVSALDYCHQNRIVHRDLKPENIMVDTNGSVRLIDFGFANLFHPRDQLTTNCGSPLYAAPEIVQAKPYIGPEVDIWSLGIVLYAMIVGALPFEDENLKGLYKKIGEGKFSFPEHVSPLARDLIRSMLQVNVLDRATIQHIRHHPWTMDGFAAPPESYMPARPSQIAHPRDELVRLLPEYGYNMAMDALRSTIIYQPDSPAFAGYCMLEEKMARENSRLSTARFTTASSTTTSTTTSSIPIKAGTPLKQQHMASSYKEYHAIPDSTWTEIEYAPRYSVNMNQSIPLSSMPGTPVKQAPTRTGIQHPSTVQNSSGGIMAQAAASVVSKLRKFRDMKFGLATGSVSPRSSKRQSQPNANNVMHL